MASRVIRSRRTEGACSMHAVHAPPLVGGPAVCIHMHVHVHVHVHVRYSCSTTKPRPRAW